MVREEIAQAAILLYSNKNPKLHKIGKQTKYVYIWSGSFQLNSTGGKLVRL